MASRGLRKFVVGSALGLVLAGVCYGLLFLAFDRTHEFRAKAREGQPIVRAIEQFRIQTGRYPASLTDLAPKYLPTVPELPDESQHKFSGWEYQTATNGEAVSYRLSYYMGRGGVEYEAPNWIGNDEGHTTVVLRDE
jgi:hypothetical protein